MSDRRRKNVPWELPIEEKASFDSAKLAVLMDIRDELQSLNRLLNCNRFIDIPSKLDRIDRNTRKKARVK